MVQYSNARMAESQGSIERNDNAQVGELIHLEALCRRVVRRRLVVLQTPPLRLRHLLLQRRAVKWLEQLEGAQQVFGHGHDRAEVVKLSAVAGVSGVSYC